MLNIERFFEKHRVVGMKSQIVILFVSICVSFAFYDLSNMVATSKLEEIESKRKNDVEVVINEDFFALEDAFMGVMELIKMSPIQVLKSKRDHVFRHDKLSSVFWVDAKELSLSNNINLVPLLNHYSKRDLEKYITPKNIQKLKETYKGFSKENIGLVKNIEIKSNIQTFSESGWASENSVLMLASLIRSSDGNLGVLLAISNTSAIFRSFSAYDNVGLERFSIKFEGEGENILTRSSIDRPFRSKELKHSFMHADFNRIYKVETFLKPIYTEIVLRAIPWIVLIISLSASYVYIAFRYYAAKRAFEMEQLNQVLADKNIALKTEIKKRERMHSTSRQSEQENKAIINALNEVIFELDIEGKICFINDAWCRVTGYDLAESIGKLLFSYITEEEGVSQTEKLQDLIQGKTAAYNVFFRLKTKAGEDKPVEMVISMLRQDHEKNLRIVGTLIDLDEKEKAEQAVEKAEENYKRIWKNAANGIYELGLDGQLISANPAMASILGYESPEQMIRSITNMSNMIYVSPHEKEEKMKEANDGAINKKFEIKAYRKDGEEIWLHEFIQFVVDEEGNTRHFEGTIDDITDRKNADIALKRAKAESDMANRAKSEFLANMSHELRTPLNSIIGFAEVIRDQVMGEIGDPIYSEYAGEVYKSGTGLLSILNQILDVSKIESGDRELNESLVKLSKTSTDTLQLFSEKIKEKQLTVVNTIDDSMIDLIAEERSVKQMLYNLLSNAVKFTSHKGTISLLMSLDDDESLRVSVKDTGEGLMPDQLERALKPFDLLDGDHSREKYGTGLGLTLVKLLMDMHGGRIDMQSEKDVGTTVSLVFPKERLRRRKEEDISEDLTTEINPINLEGADVFSVGNKSVH